VDELAKWRKGQETWDMLQLCMRLGDNPQSVVTTTPRNVGILKKILNAPGTVRTHAPTEVNRHYLAPNFIEAVRSQFAGNYLARQELDGELIEDTEGALWTVDALDRCLQVGDLPVFDRVVVAVDPPVTGKSSSDDCGIVVVGANTKGRVQDWRAVVLEDATLKASSPTVWAQAALDAMARHGADRLVAEVNQGGDLVETVIRQLDPLVPYRAVTATRGKVVRAEPIAALYEQGRVAHRPGLEMLEAQMCKMSRQGYQDKCSPDRVDALVWALTELMVSPGPKRAEPTIRSF
jgi:phage terminase large subunit-like protein